MTTNYEDLVRRAYAQTGTPTEKQDPTLAQQIAVRVDQLLPHLAGRDEQGEGYLAKLGRLNAARQQAVEMALHDLLPTSSTSSTSSSGENEADDTLPAIWPTDPAHPLNDDQLVETMSTEEIRRHLSEFDQSPEQQSRAANLRPPATS